MTITVQLGALQVKKLPSLGSFCMTLTAACFASEKTNCHEEGSV